MKTAAKEMPVDLDAPPVKVTVGDDVALDEPPSTVPLGCSDEDFDVSSLFAPAKVPTVAVVVSPVSITLTVAEGPEEAPATSGTPSTAVVFSSVAGGAGDAVSAATV